MEFAKEKLSLPNYISFVMFFTTVNIFYMCVDQSGTNMICKLIHLWYFSPHVNKILHSRLDHFSKTINIDIKA